MTKKEILIKVATMQSLMAGAKGTSKWVKNLGRRVNIGLARNSGDTIGGAYKWLKNNNNQASQNYSKVNKLSKLLMGPLPVPGGIAAGAGLKAGINAVQAGNDALMKNPKLMDKFQKGLSISKMIIPT